MKIKDTTETNTYISGRGYYVIRQPEGEDSDGYMVDAGVALSPEQMRLIIVDMEAKLLSADKWWSAQSSEESEG